MLFYFSGTGNSRWVAGELTQALRETPISIVKELQKTGNNLSYALQPDEPVVFVFPVHSWGPAVLVGRFIQKMKLTGYVDQPVYAVCTCGGECGYTAKIMRKALAKKNIALTKTFSVIMPNNYILLPGFNTDSKEVETAKLANATPRLQAIVNSIQQNTDEEFYEMGRFPIFRSDIVYPLFRKFYVGRNSFYATNKCISCMKCVEVCPTQTIYFENGKPKWKNTCVQCLACIHRCPVRAIEYGKISLKKGRYHHPALR